MKAARTLGLALGGLLVGTVTGVAAVALHQYPWGLALTAAAAGAAAYAPGPGAARVLLSAGLAAVVVRASLARPEGDFLVLSNGTGWTLITGALALLVWAGASTVLAGARRPAPAHDQGDSGTPT